MVFEEGKPAINDENLLIDCVKVVNSEKDILTKQDFCYFCKTLQTSIKRHLKTVHKNEVHAMKAESNKKMRKKLLGKIKGKGSF